MIHMMNWPVAEGGVFFVVALETEQTGLNLYSAPMATEEEALLLQAEWQQAMDVDARQACSWERSRHRLDRVRRGMEAGLEVRGISRVA
jgi:hypothetical protein